MCTKALGLNSFVIWNVQCACLYTVNEGDTQFVLLKQWPILNHISNRESVPIYRSDWKKLADQIISDLNTLFEDGSLEGRPFVESSITGGIQDLILANTSDVAKNLKQNALRDSELRAEITLWWESYKKEYQYPKKNKYQVLAHANLCN